MTKLLAVVTDYIEPNLDWEKEQCQEMGVDFKDYQLKTAGPKELIRVTQDADVVVVNMAPIDEHVINEMKRCKLIIRHGIGYDNVDITAASLKGIQVVNIPDYCVEEVSEQSVMLIMACQRKLIQQNQIINISAKTGQWHFHNIYPVYRIAGKTIGIVGFGRIGTTVFRMLQGFGTKFIIVDPYISDDRKKQFGIETSPFEVLLKESDIITVHVPLKWGETFHMFDAPQFELMKPNAVLVNTSRGGIVNLDALDIALRHGNLAMAGIDVYEKEPPSDGLAILNNPNAICTPHLSWLSEESGISIRQKIIGNIRKFLNGEEQTNVVNSVKSSF